MSICSRFENAVFHAILFATLCIATFVGSHYAVIVDVTRESRNSLNDRSLAVLARLTQPLVIELYADKGSLLVQAGRDLVERYSRASKWVRYEHIDISRDPHISREMHITGQGDVVIKMADRRRSTKSLTEAAVTGAIESLMIAESRRAVFISGHGERRPLGAANHDYGELSERLKERGYEIDTVNLLLDDVEPRSGDVLVIASSQAAWRREEMDMLNEYIASGGDALWLVDEQGVDTDLIRELTGLKALPGVVVDAASEALDLPKPDFAIVSQYGQHSSLQGIDGISLFPRAIAFSDSSLHTGWRADALLQSTARSWNETGEIAGHITPDQPGEVAGPLTFGWRLTHDSLTGTLTVLGDGDFLANSWLGNGVNLALGERLLDTLAGQDAVVVTSTPPLDRHITMTRTQGVWLGGALFGALPLILSSIAFWVWRRQAY